MPRRTGYTKHLDDISRAILHKLGGRDGFGFAYEVIAALAFRKKVRSVTPKEVSSVSGFFRRNGYSIRRFRHAQTAHAWEFAQSKAKLPKPRRRRLRRLHAA